MLGSPRTVLWLGNVGLLYELFGMSCAGVALSIAASAGLSSLLASSESTVVMRVRLPDSPTS